MSAPTLRLGRADLWGRPLVVAGGLAAVLVGGCFRSQLAASDETFDDGPGPLQIEPAAIEVSLSTNEVTEITLTVDSALGPSVSWTATASTEAIEVDVPSGTTPATVTLSVHGPRLLPGEHAEGVTFWLPDGQRAVDVPVVASVEQSRWTPLEGPAGGHLMAVAVAPDDPAWVVAAARDLWGDVAVVVSQDGGHTVAAMVQVIAESWSEVGRIRLGPQGRGYLVAAEKGLYRTFDGGFTWEPGGSAGQLWDVAVSPVDPDLVLVAADDEVLRSTDGGMTWTSICSGWEPHFVDPDPTAPGWFVMGGSDSNLYRTDGEIFETIAVPLAGCTLEAGVLLATGRWVVASSDCDAVAISDDQGATWLPAGMGLLDAPRRFVGGVQPGSLFAVGAGGSVAVSWDEGFTFQQAPILPPAFPGAIRDVAPVAGGALVASARAGMLWLDAVAATQTAAAAQRIGRLRAGPGELFAIASHGDAFALRPPGGWQSLVGRGWGEFWAMSDIAVDPRDEDVIWLAADGYPALLATSDGGRTWEDRSGAVGDPKEVFQISRVPGDPSVLWVAAETGLYRSTNGGQSFMRVRTTTVFAVVAISRTACLWYDTSWVLGRWNHFAGASTPITDEDVEMLTRGVDGSLWYGSYDGGLFRSTDDGQTFEALGRAGRSPADLLVDVRDPAVIYVAYPSEGLHVSRDGGSTWTEIEAPFPPTALAQDPASAEVYVGTLGGGIYRYHDGP